MYLKNQKMKKLLIISVFYISINLTNAQSPVIDLLNQGAGHEQGAYYKDTNNYLDEFVGTWIFTNLSTNTNLEIRLFKKIMNQSNNNTYEDILYGEYKYVENGVEKLNTLSNLSINYTNVENYGIDGNYLLDKKSAPLCIECTSNQKGIGLIITENGKEISYNFKARVFNIGGQFIMKALIYSDGISFKGLPSTGNQIKDLVRQGIDVGVTIPIGYYDLIKQ
jgi:hypothetical protein